MLDLAGADGGIGGDAGWRSVAAEPGDTVGDRAMSDYPESWRTIDVLREVADERRSQDRKWGEQNHTPIEWITIETEEFGEAARGAYEAHFHGATLESYRRELVQVAAVAVAAIESLDRQEGL